MAYMFPIGSMAALLQMKCRARQRRPRKDPAPNPHHWEVGMAKIWAQQPGFVFSAQNFSLFHPA